MSPTNCTCNIFRMLCKVATLHTIASRNLCSPTASYHRPHCTLPPIHSSYSTSPLRLEQQHSQGPMPAGCTRRCTGRKVRTQAHALEIESSYSVSSYSLLNLVESRCLSGKAPHRPCWLQRMPPPPTSTPGRGLLVAFAPATSPEAIRSLTFEICTGNEQIENDRNVSCRHLTFIGTDVNHRGRITSSATLST